MKREILPLIINITVIFPANYKRKKYAVFCKMYTFMTIDPILRIFLY